MESAFSAEKRLLELGIELPAVPDAAGSYRSARRAGQLLYLSGQGPRDQSGTLLVGKVGADLDVGQAREHAYRIGLQLLSTIRKTIGSLDHVESVVKLLGMVNATPDFRDHPKVIDGCSRLLVDVLGERGEHARSAIGVGSLPFGMSVEIEAIILIQPGH